MTSRLRAVISRLRLVGVALVGVLLLSSCVGGVMEQVDRKEPVNPFTPFWDGELPLAERQSIEDYQTEIEPLVRDILTGLDDLNMGDIERLSESRLSECFERDEHGNMPSRAFEVRGASYVGEPIDIDAAAALMESIVVPAGFATRTQAGDPSDVTIEWHNTQDGGYFSLLIMAKSHTAVSYRSGCRPTNGATTERGRTVPDWETEYPEVPDPTPTTPAP